MHPEMIVNVEIHFTSASVFKQFTEQLVKKKKNCDKKYKTLFI